MLTSQSFTSMLVAQVLNGFFIGVCATLGMVVLQDMMRDRLGTASTLFSSMLSISMLVASLSVGIVGELYNYYSTLYVSLGGVIIAVVLLWFFAHKVRHNRNETLTAPQSASIH
jgi:SET family sugar efflux transporter-like MFS transporter